MLAAPLLWAAAIASPAEPVLYRLELAQAGDTSVAVSIELPAAAPGPLMFAIPLAADGLTP